MIFITSIHSRVDFEDDVGKLVDNHKVERKSRLALPFHLVIEVVSHRIRQHKGDGDDMKID